MNLRFSQSLITALILVGCGGNVRPDETARLSDTAVCGEYGDEARDFRKWGMGLGQSGTFIRGKRVDGVVAEIKQRELLSAEHSSEVLAGHVEPGMTAVETLCAWGNPKSAGGPAPDGSVVWTYEASFFTPAAAGQLAVVLKDGRVSSVER